MHGPKVGCDPRDARRRRKTYLLAAIDDATGVILCAAFAFSESSDSFLTVLRQALERRGVPRRLYVDYVAGHIIDEALAHLVRKVRHLDHAATAGGTVQGRHAVAPQLGPIEIERSNVHHLIPNDQLARAPLAPPAAFAGPRCDHPRRARAVRR